ncbi:helix-turn-helix domain-containing protein [Mesorhizobium sp. M0815]
MAKVTQRGALNLIADLGVREMTGRGRYRAWAIIWTLPRLTIDREILAA